MGSSPGMMAWRCDFNCKPTGAQLMTEGDQPGEGFKDAFFLLRQTENLASPQL